LVDHLGLCLLPFGYSELMSGPGTRLHRNGAALNNLPFDKVQRDPPTPPSEGALVHGSAGPFLERA